MFNTNKDKKNVENQLTKKCKTTSSNSSKNMQYSVVKKHHRLGWLKQERLLEITSTHIFNCKPSRGNGLLPEITKSFPLTSIMSIGIKGKNSFCIYVRNDHSYYYYTPKAIEIAHKIQRYVAASNAVESLLEFEDKRKKKLMGELIKGSIPLPGSQMNDAGSSFPYRSYRSAKLRCEISRVLRHGIINGSDKLFSLVNIWNQKKEDEELNLIQLRNEISFIRDQCASHIMEQNPYPPQEVLYSDIVMCVEDVIQGIIITPNFDKIMSFLRRDEVLVEREVLFNSKREILRGKSAEYFNVPKELRSIDYKFVLRHFDLLKNLRNPNNLLEQLVNIAACISLTIHVAVKYSNIRNKRVSVTSVVGQMFNNNNNNNNIQSNNDNNNSNSKPAPFTAVVSLPIENTVEDANAEEEFSLTQFFSSSNSSLILDRLERDGLSTDDMLPLFIHLLCESDIPDLCFLLYFIEILRDPEDTSERAYYFTTLAAAIAMVCEGGADGEFINRK